MNLLGRLTDDDGNEYRIVAAGPTVGWTVNQDGTVTHFEEEDGERKEHTEPLHSSPVRGVFAPWVWDAMDDALDPRNESPSGNED